MLSMCAMAISSDNSGPRRAGPRIRVLRLILAMVLASGLIGYFVVAPLLVRHAVKQSLRDIGVDAAAFDLDSVSLTAARFRRLELGAPQWLRADAITVRYSPLSLFRGRVKTIDVTDARWTVRIDKGVLDLGFDPARIPTTGGGLDLPFDHLQVNAAQLALLIDGVPQAMDGAGSIRRTGAGRLACELALSAEKLSYSGFDVLSPRLTARLDVSALADGHRAVEGQIEFSDASLHSARHQLEIPTLAAVIPVSTHGTTVDDGSIRIGRIVWRGVELPPPAGGLNVAGSRVHLRLDWPFMPGATTDVEGWLEFQALPLQGRLTVIVPEFELTDASLIRKVVPALNDVELGGRFAVNSTFTLANGQLNQRISVSANRASLNSVRWPGQIDDADGSITLTGLSPLSTEPDQTLFVNKARVGEVEITNGAVVFSGEGERHISVQHASCTMERKAARLGRFELNSFSTDLADVRFNSTLYCEDVELGPWLELLTNDRVTGDGRLEGLIAFAFDANRYPAVVLGNGVLEARPERGVIQILDHAIIDKVIAQIDPSGQKYVEQIRDRIALALRDFEYSALRVELSAEGDDVVCQLTTQGHGRIGPDPQEFASITLNVAPFNAIVRRAVLGREIFAPME
jgi:hypothetical protein